MMSFKSYSLILLVFMPVILMSCGSSHETPSIGEIQGIPDNKKVVTGQVYHLSINPSGSLLDWTDFGWTSNHSGDVFGNSTNSRTTYIPSSVTAKTDAEITCTATHSGDAPQTASIQFKIVPASEQWITVGFPNGGETLYQRAGATISWGSQNVQEDVKIEYSSDDFVNEIIVLTAETPNTGSWDWYRIEVGPTTTGKIRITSLVDPSVTDTSNDYFIVRDTPH